MIRTIEDFKDEWGHELEATIRIFRTLTDSSLTQKAVPEGRTLGRLAWHITVTVGEMLSKTGLKTDAPDEHSDPPASANAIVEAYEKAARSALKLVSENWTDATLLEEDPMYGETWKRGFTLSVLVRHQIHHRAQMTVLMRMAGLKVPGIYGPAREEWAEFGMPVMQ